MTTQQRDTDLTHVRVGTTIGFGAPRTIDITPHKPYEIVEVDDEGNPWFRDDAGDKRFIFPDLHFWDRWRGYIISQPDEAPEAPALDEAANKVIVRNSLSSSAIAAAKTELGLDITNGQFLGLLWLAGCHPALDEAAIRDKALEDAARVCEKNADKYRASFMNSHTKAKSGAWQGALSCAAAIRQMKGAGV